MLIAFFAIIYKPLNLQRPFQKSEVRDSECLVYSESTCIAGAFFLNSHSFLADIGKNYYICIGIEALFADRLWNSLPSVNMQNCITFLNALCETGAAKEKWAGLFFRERPGSFLPIPRCPGKENTN